MKFTSTAFASLVALAASVSARPFKRDVDPSLIPQFGFVSGVNPTGTGDCDGAVNGADGKPIKIPCACPPDRNLFIADLNANVAAGFATHNPSVKVTFPTSNSAADQSARLNAATVTLQNLNGPGQGCPVVSTTFSAQNAAIQAGQDPNTVPSVIPNSAPAQTSAAPAQPTSAAPAAPTSAPPTATSASGTPSAAQISALAPALGGKAGVNPTGTGNCDGAVDGPDGKPIAVPCACPPDQDDFNNALVKNVQAGKAVNNPSVAVSFPTGSSNQDQAARIEAAIVTLQNLNGPGQGCPAASTTLSAQLKAAQS